MNPELQTRCGTSPTKPRTDARREERRTLIANNKAWDTAETVRRDWIREKFLSRKVLLKGAAVFVATTLTGHRGTINDDHRDLAGVFLGVDGGHHRGKLATLVGKTPTKAGHVTLAVAIAGRENHTNRYSWRSPNGTDSSYLCQLEKWGYTLSAVERIAAGHPASSEKTVDEEPTAS